MPRHAPGGPTSQCMTGEVHPVCHQTIHNQQLQMLLLSTSNVSHDMALGNVCSVVWLQVNTPAVALVQASRRCMTMAGCTGPTAGLECVETPGMHL
jgi:hypothetical protein